MPIFIWDYSAYASARQKFAETGDIIKFIKYSSFLYELVNIKATDEIRTISSRDLTLPINRILETKTEALTSIEALIYS